MKKEEQIKINNLVNTHYIQCMYEFDGKSGATYLGRLRNCSAGVWETDNYYILQSYNTKIACIDKRTNVLYDFLRLVYGYTSTSAQHIAKFRHDYTAYTEYRYYNI